MFFQELLTLCDSDDSVLSKLPCYKGVPSLVPLKICGLCKLLWSRRGSISYPAALAACTYLVDMREKIFSVLYKAINSGSADLQTAGKDAMRKVLLTEKLCNLTIILFSSCWIPHRVILNWSIVPCGLC